MKAKILPLKGKYYGTIISITDHAGKVHEIKFWDNGDFTPSDRELERHGFTREQWQENVLVESGWGIREPVQQVLEICDSHFESQKTYKLCLQIVDAINSYGSK